jgi:hypothetical protein
MKCECLSGNKLFKLFQIDITLHTLVQFVFISYQISTTLLIQVPTLFMLHISYTDIQNLLTVKKFRCYRCIFCVELTMHMLSRRFWLYCIYCHWYNLQHIEAFG